MRLKFLITLLFLLSCESKPEFHVFGKLKDIMQDGKIGPTFDPTQIEDFSNVYGLGAVEQLKGELIVLNGKMFKSSVVHDTIQTITNFNSKATLFAYAKIYTWDSYTVNDSINNQNISELIESLGKKSGYTTTPFFFRIEGSNGQLDWHVIDTPQKMSNASHKDHKSAAKNGNLENQEFTILGTFSRNHKHILSHGSSFLHMHVYSKDQNIVGHVDDVKLKSPITIYIQGQN